MTRDIQAANVVRHRLQRLLLSDETTQRDLYWRKVDPSGHVFHDSVGTSVGPGSTLRLDTFLNSFYERYWRDLTDLPSLDLSVTTSGPCSIRVVRRCPHRPDAVVAKVVSHGELTQSVLRISFATLPIADAVLHAEIEAWDEQVLLHDGAWTTNAPPCNVVRLTIVTCSFGRESTLVENLGRLADVIARDDSVAEYLVVHQGVQPLSEFPPYTALLSESALAKKLRLLQQRNFGGTGGFTRGMMEALKTSATHVLLLDDDIKVEPWIIERLTALLSRLVSSTIIGGQMLDLFEPTILRASHEHARLDMLELENPYTGLDLTRPEAAVSFARRNSSGYNAWWCCCIPTVTVREIGFPVPMFIRHDDVEYGIRAAARGTPTVTMPGIFVWHEPFTKKAKATIVYYQYRNFLITSALHGRLRRFRFVLKHCQRALAALKRHRYEYCWALCRALDDFLAGPASNFADLPGRHRDLTTAQARVTLLTMASARYHADPERRRRMRARLSVAAVVLLGQRGLKPLEATFAATIRTLVFAIVRSSLAFLWYGKQAAHTYRAEASTFTSPVYWRILLGLPSEDP